MFDPCETCGIPDDQIMNCEECQDCCYNENVWTVDCVNCEFPSYDVIWFVGCQMRVVHTSSIIAAEELLELLLHRKVEKGDIRHAFIQGSYTKH